MLRGPPPSGAQMRAALCLLSLVASRSLRAARETTGLNAQRVACTRTPGAGMDPESIAPFSRSFKDGYFHVDCAVDKMETKADKFGDERHSYDADAGFTGRGNVSIVRYEEHVDREEQKLMTGRVCFNFCRSVPNMTFFGLIHGRHCYCMPYFLKDGKGGQGTCDLGCEGDTSEICGGLKTTSVYAMHNCANTEEDLASSLAALAAEAGKVAQAGAKGRALAEEMEAVADALMSHVVERGDMLAHANGQSSKVFAGKVLHPPKLPRPPPMT